MKTVYYTGTSMDCQGAMYLSDSKYVAHAVDLNTGDQYVIGSASVSTVSTSFDYSYIIRAPFGANFLPNGSAGFGD